MEEKNDGRFKKGQIPWNKGTKGLTKENSGSFRKGHNRTPHKPLGTEIERKDGYLARKVATTGNIKTDWRFKHHLVWEEHHGTIPKGHIIIFKDGNFRNFDIENLECISRAENVRRNMKKFNSKYPEEYRKAIRAVATLKKVITEKRKV